MKLKKTTHLLQEMFSNKIIIVRVPFKTPSVNHLYGQRGWRKFLKPEAKKLRGEIIQLCDKTSAQSLQSSKLRVVVEIYENWWQKNGGVRRADVANREKFLIDSVFEGFGLDDKWIFENKLIKKQSDEEFAIIRIEALE